jgi:hypothetical protein
MTLIIRGIMVIAGLATAGFAAREVGDAAEDMGEAAQKSTNLAKYVAISGGLFLAYKGLKSGGVIK